MLIRTCRGATLGAAIALAAASFAVAAPANAQVAVSEADDVRAGELAVPLNKSQVLRTDRPNVFPINDPIGAVVWGMDTSNVDAVFVDGRALMRDGVLTADVERARGLAVEARERIAAASGPLPGAVPEGVP